MRSQLELIIAIFKCIGKHPKIKTSLMMEYSGVNYDRGKQLLDYLVYHEFINVDEKNRHTITLKALKWLNQIEPLIKEVTDNGEVRT